MKILRPIYQKVLKTSLLVLSLKVCHSLIPQQLLCSHLFANIYTNYGSLNVTFVFVHLHVQYPVLVCGCVSITYIKAQRERQLTWQTWGWPSWFCVSAVLAYIHVTIHINNRNKSYNTSEAHGEDFGTTFRQKSTFQRAEFKQKNQINGKQQEHEFYTYCRLGHYQNYR